MRTKKRVSLAFIITMLTLFCFMGSILTPYAHAEEFLDDSVPTNESQTTVEKEEKSFWDSFLGFLGVDSTPKINFQLEVANMSDYSGAKVLVKPGDQITVTAYLEDYRDATEEVGSLSVEFPKGNKGKYIVAENPTSYVDGSQIETTSGGNYIFVYCPIPEEDTITTSEVSAETDPCPVIPKGTEKDTRLFSFTVQIATTEITAGDEFSLELSEIVLGDADDNFISNGDGVEYNSGTDAKKTVNFKVTNENISVSGIELAQDVIYPFYGQDGVQLTAKIIPENASNKTITWESNNDDIAVVSEGKVSAGTKGYGEATITAKTVDGNKTAKCTANVSLGEMKTFTLNLMESIDIINYTRINLPENINIDQVAIKYWPQNDNDDVVINQYQWTRTKDEHLEYAFVYENLYAFEMGKIICAQFVIDANDDGDFETLMGSVNEYSIKAYAMNKVNYPDEDLVALLKSLLNYGAESQTFFEEDTDNLANEGLSEQDKIVPTVTSEDLNDYKSYLEDNENDNLFEFVSNPLEVSSKINMRIHVKPTENNKMDEEQILKLKCRYEIIGSEEGSNTLPLYKRSETSDQYLVLISIPSFELTKMYKLYIEDENGKQISDTKVCGAFSYCEDKLTTGSESLKKICSAIVDYGRKANNYFNK